MSLTTRHGILRIATPCRLRASIVLSGALLAALALPASALAVEEDITPPQVEELSVSPSAVNVTSEAKTVTVTAKIADPPGTGGVSSGVSEGTITYAAPGKASRSFCFEAGYVCGTFVKKSGEEWTASITFPKFAAAGTWQPTVRVVDHAGNFREYTPAQLEAAGFHVDVEVTSAPDTTPPEVTSVTVGPPG